MLKPPSYSKIQKPLLHPPTYIAYKNIRFLITDTPCINNMSRYIKEFERWNVTDVVRCCEATYSQTLLNQHGIQVHDWTFSDGAPPPKCVIDEWLDLIDGRFKHSEDNTDDDLYHVINKRQPCIATHCVAGLGRAPVLVAIALIEEGMEPLDSIAFIRSLRKGSINNRQLKYLESYKRRKRSSVSCCIS
ncbi:dual specificity protein phosphatase CDC14B [Mucor ambiguus]|uniref:protein-tyrosine-phosphatase n=1 Tax=Mucor ambiguus TaxID=91626 RepID=A0A0C9MKP1_9FUNG|nr:dual specificity protein phosphatase CDC14B [Mucor ambiguus]